MEIMTNTKHKRSEAQARHTTAAETKRKLQIQTKAN